MTNLTVEDLGENAYVAHPSSDIYVSYVKSGGKWFTLDPLENGTIDTYPTSENVVQRSVDESGFVVHFAGF